MRYAAITDRLAGLGADKWAVHARARALAAEGRAIIELTIGEPDVAPPPSLIDAAAAAMRAGRTRYSNGRGEPKLVAALAARYTALAGRPIGAENIVCFPGTQTALHAALTALAEPGDAVLVADPMYATYEGLIRATGATLVPVPLRPGRGFRLAPEDVAARVTPASRLLFLNTPHNPTGAVLRPEDLRGLGAIARAHDLWIVCDEVYEELAFAAPFTSALQIPEIAGRTVVAASISKSHAAPGFRSGWCVGPAEFCARLLPLAEIMLFGNQPFVADATAAAVAAPSPTAAALRATLARRAALVARRLDGTAGLRVVAPEAGMFALVDVAATGLDGEAFAFALLEEAGVAVMPGAAFGAGIPGYIRLGLVAGDDALAEALARIARFAEARTRRRA